MSEKNEIVVVEKQSLKNELSLSSDDVKRTLKHLEVVKQAVRDVMVEGIDNDYAVIPGTQKQALLKPGAEKLLRLFGLGVRFQLIDKEFDRYENFAMYSYNAEVYHLSTGTVLAQCEGTANSQEKKYKERAIYVQGKRVGMEPTPICDVLNTLKKMAQKRAMVGATIMAVGASDYFSQDEDEVEAQGPQKRDLQQSEKRFDGSDAVLGDYLIPVGKFKGSKLADVKREDLISYCEWTVRNNKEINGQLKEFIDKARDFLKGEGK